MAVGDKQLSELPKASDVLDNDLLLIEQAGVAMSMSGAQLLTYLQPLLNRAVGLLPTAASINFTNWTSGYFTETLQDGSIVEYPVFFDNNGVPTSIGGITIQGVTFID